MKITLNEITFTKEEMTSFLQENGYKIETNYEVTSIIADVPLHGYVDYAIPSEENFDKNKHKSIDETFEDLIQNGVKKFILSLS